jgi:rod shape-determining protein MreC
MAINKIPFVKRLTSFALFIALEVVSLLLVANTSIFQQTKFMGAYMAVYKSIAGIRSGINYYFNLSEVNDRLMEENNRLLSELERYRAIYESDSTRTDTAGTKVNFSYINARVISNSTNKKHNFILIDKGAIDGVKKDMGVVSPSGVIGVVHSVSSKFSMVISFLNINQSVSAKINTSGAFGPLIWDGQRLRYAILTEVPQHIKFMPGDTISTSGFSSIFPPDIPIGTIGKSKIIKGTQHEIQVRLFQDFTTLKYVRVVINRNKEELEKLIEANETDTH